MRKIAMLIGAGLIIGMMILANYAGKDSLQAQETEREKNPRDEMRVTVYNPTVDPYAGYWSGNRWYPSRRTRPARAYIKDRRVIDIKRGSSTLHFTDVAKQMDHTSVFFKSLDRPKDVNIVEQNYEYDLVSAHKIMGKYIDKEIEIITKNDVIKGTLLSFDGQAIVIRQGENGKLNVITRGENVKSIRFPKLPEGLITRPTLVWKVQANKGGKQLTEVSYLTSGMDWRTDYVAVLNGDDTKMDFGAWITLTNNSGATYENAKLKLVAGDVDTYGRRQRYARTMQPPPGKGGKTPEYAPGIKQRTIFEFPMYDLARKTTIKDKQVKQVTLFPTVKDVPVVKYFLYDGRVYGKKVRVNVKFLNSKGNNLGIPLPEGRLRVSKMDTDGALEFIGEDAIDHTAKDEEVDVFLGNAFDVVGEWKQTNTNKIARNVWEYSFEIKLRNHKKEDVKVIVREHMWGGDWRIVQANEIFQTFKKKDAHTVECEVDVPKGGDEVILTYTVRYTWW